MKEGRKGRQLGKGIREEGKEARVEGKTKGRGARQGRDRKERENGKRGRAWNAM